jgi:hypothetical protein
VELRMHTRNLCLVEAVVELVDHCYPAEEAAVAGELRDHWSYLEAEGVVVEELWEKSN